MLNKLPISVILAISTPILGIFSFRFAGFTFRYSDPVIFALLPFHILPKFIGRPRIDPMIWLFLLLPTAWITSSIGSGNTDTALLNNVKDYYCFGAIYYLLRYSSRNLHAALPVFAILTTAYLGYGLLAIGEIWRNDIKLHSLDSENYRTFNLNSWGYGCCLPGAFFLGICTLEAGRLGKLTRQVLYVISIALLGASLLSLSRAAITLTFISLLYIAYNGGWRLKSILQTSLTALLAICVVIYILSLYPSTKGDSGFLDTLFKKGSTYFDDLIRTRIWEINLTQVLTFADKAAPMQFFFGTVNAQQHSSALMFLFYGGLVSLLGYIICIGWALRSFNHPVQILVITSFILNDLMTNGAAWHPPIGYMLVICLSLSFHLRPQVENRKPSAYVIY
jgi:hypothetical protein